MEKNPSERIQTASEVAERLAPWASDDSPLLSEDMTPQRWTSNSLSSADNQDTDPNDIAELAMSEISSASGLQGTIGNNDPGYETGSLSAIFGKKKPPPPPLSTAEQYTRAGRIPKNDMVVSVSTMFIICLICLSIGILIGFIGGFYFPR